MKITLKQTKSQLQILCFCCLLMIFIVRPWELYFLNDDFIHIPLDIHYLFERGGFMRPVPNVFLEMDKWLYGKNALGFFSTTLLLHFACVFCVYAFVKKAVTYFLDTAGLEMLPLVTAVLFLFYPFHAEALMWTISRVATMATVFTLLSLHFYLTASRSKLHLVLSFLFFAIALFTYESMWNVMLLFAVISFLRFKQGKSSMKKEAIIYTIFLAGFIIYMLIRVKVLNSLTGNGYDTFQQNLHDIRFLFSNWLKLIARNFTPSVLSAKLFAGLCAGLIAVHIFFGTKAARKNREAGILLLLCITGMVTAVVTASILGIDTHRNEGDRYLYYSSFFYCLFVAIIIVVLVKGNTYRALAVACCSIVFIGIFCFYQGNYSYASSVTKATTRFVRNYPAAKNAYFIDVPQAINGSLIFRTGLADAIRWTSPGVKYENIKLLSQVAHIENKHRFSTGETSWNELSAAKNLPANIPAVKDSSGNEIMLQQGDVLFWFKENGLYKVNLPVIPPSVPE